MALSGFRNPTVGTGSGWTTPGNIFLSDDSDATYAGSTQEFLEAETFGFNIPNNAIIRGFEVQVEGSSATSRTVEVFLTKNGTASTGTSLTQALSASDTINVLGGATNLFGTTWDVAEVNASTFGVFLRDNVASASDLNIDHIMLRVYYDFGIRGEWDVDYDDVEIIHIDSYVDYDGGTGGTAPADEDVVFDTTNNSTGRLLGVSGASVLAAGTMIVGEQHEANFANNDSLEICSYADFDAEGSGGVTEADIGSTFTASGTGTRTGTIRHVRSDGSTGRIWWDPTGQGGTAVVNNDTITIDGTGRTVTASAGEATNAWTGAVNGAEITTAQGVLNYITETASFESVSGSGRIRDTLGFQHNMCVLDTTSDATAMLVDDFEDPNATDTGKLFLIDINGTFGDTNLVIALEEVDFDAEANGGFAVGDNVGDAASPTHDWFVRRLIDNGDGTGTLYLERNAGSARFADNDAIFIVSSTQNGTANGAQRQREGSATISGTLTTTNVQWPNSHLFSDIQDQIDELLNLDDQVPMTAQVLDQQYTAINTWLVPFYSTRRIKKGALNEIGTVGGGDNDSVFTNYFHLGSLATEQNIYLEQSSTVQEQFWDAGPHDVLVRNRNKNLAVDGGTVRWYVRPFGELYDFFAMSPVGLRNPVPLNTASDLNNATAYATVRDDATSHGIEIGWASHTINFDTGTGTTLEVGDVIHNTTDNTAVMVVRVPNSLTSGTDLHVAAHGQTLTWGDGQTLDLLDYTDFDAQASQFILGEAVENQTDTWNATVQFVQQFGNSRGRMWFSNATGTLANDDTIRLNGAGATRATSDGGEVTANDWQALTNTATPDTADITALKDIGQGGDQPYNVVLNLNGAGVAVLYEWTKLITEERAGSTTDPGSLLYPNDTAVQGRLYRQADSAFPAAEAVKSAPFGTFAGGTFFGARGVFIENMLAADAQAYQLIDSNGTTRNPPNVQSVTVTGLVIGDTVAVFRRAFTDGVSLTYNDNDGTGNSEITRGAGSFIRDGHRVGESVTVSGTASNDGTYTVTAVAALTLTLSGIVLTDEGPIASDLLGTAVDKETFQGAATGNDLGDPDFVVQESLPTDLPASGTIVIVNTNGSEIYEDQLAYTSFTGSTFTLSGTLPRAYDADARVYVPLIIRTSTATTESQSIIFDTGVGPFPIKTRVRRKGILPFEVDGTFGTAGVSVAAIRTPDTIVE